MIRGAQQADWQDITDIYTIARSFMRQTGNPTQWGDKNPDPAVIRRDMAQGNFYVLEREGRVQAVFSFLPGEDPTYGEIDGAWLSDRPYWAIHRVASRGEAHGLTGEIFTWCMDRCGHLRIDTHADNKPMQRAIEKFRLCLLRHHQGPRRHAQDLPLRKLNRHNKPGRFFQRNGPVLYGFGLIRRSKTPGIDLHGGL